MTNFAEDRTKVNSETLVYQAHLSQRRHITTPTFRTDRSQLFVSSSSEDTRSQNSNRETRNANARHRGAQETHVMTTYFPVRIKAHRLHQKLEERH